MTLNLVSHFRMLGRYNRLANARLYGACSEIDDEDRKRDRGAFFGSIHGTLNHILVGDRIWMARFEGGEATSTNLDAILYDDFDALREARTVEDGRIEAYTGRLTEKSLAGTIAYVNNDGRSFRDPLAMLLTHLFNHQTHHRGQVTAMLSQTEARYPVLDMHRVLVPEPGKPVAWS
jgi:uncharacterized damage-inducible protein DinB